MEWAGLRPRSSLGQYQVILPSTGVDLATTDTERMGTFVVI